MISRNLFNQIFGKMTTKASNKPYMMSEKECLAGLEKAGIDVTSTERIADVVLKLPCLKGNNIETHFFQIAKEQITPYEELLLQLVNCEELPVRPKSWSHQIGWTKYESQTGNAVSVEYPEDDALVFDVEVCVTEGALPTLATAVSKNHWYSWVSSQVDGGQKEKIASSSQRYNLSDLIPLGMNGPKVIVGHNVSYDRSRLREQYLLEDTGARFIDTMSLHMCVSGITSYQRALLKSKKEPSVEDTEWLAKSSLNSLAEVYSLYCGGATLSKEPRNVFLEGSLYDVKANFQGLMDYCASDVEATFRVLKALYPMFSERFPHPATLAGMLELSSAYLPVNSNWNRFIYESDLTYKDLNIEAKYHLSRRADEACSLLKGDQYHKDLWLWDEDWSIQQLKLKQTKNIKKTTTQSTDTSDKCAENLSTEELRLRRKFQYLYDTKSLLPARRPILPGYPAWYRKLCRKQPTGSITQENIWAPGATEISTGMQIAPKLLSLCWEGYPLYYLKDYGWGFLVPFRKEHPKSETSDFRIPLEKLVERCPVIEFDRRCDASKSESEYGFDCLHQDLERKLVKREFYSKSKKDFTNGQYKGSGVWCNKILEHSCYFFKLPHKNGNSFRVGNPLSKDFLNKFSDNVLSSGDAGSGSANRIIEIARMMSYWRNNRDRILNQMVVWLPADYITERLKTSSNCNLEMEFGAICPQVVVCGTLTRRAMESTWMTASNSKTERIGSELRAMVQAPPTYKIVGADVDSQELWIASMLGDAYACGMHGGTPLGWMSLSGTKSKGTDMHSITAKAVGISRDHAKVINYARIYGAGQNFAEGLLRQFNPTLSSAEAKMKAMKMFSLTKGKKSLTIRPEFREHYEERDYSVYEATKIATACNRSINEMFLQPRWKGGTESAMFNRLEEIANGETQVTPFLDCRLSRALELKSENNDNRFLPTRINWVVQSGAVDFLHLMLVSMRWLMGPNVRFCLSFHDELRYLVKEEMQYKAALAMHITNLLTRSFCASKVGLSNLPMSVAFFSSVEVDKVLRKESTMDCKTPSNPHGLKVGYGIPSGESLNIYEAINKAGTHDLSQWEWIK